MTASTWMNDGTMLLLDRVDALPVRDPAAGAVTLTGLPGWTRAHLLAHLACNAVALRRLVTWARTGIETPMYASREDRDAEIEDGARKPLAELVQHVHSSAADFARDLDELPDNAWDTQVRTAQGREVPAREIVWMRTREVWVHAVDLDPAHVSFRQFPRDLLAALVTDVVAMFSRRHEVPCLTVVADDAGLRWTVGDGADRRAPSRELTTTSGVVAVVRGDLPELAAWLTGRGTTELITSEGQPAPQLPAWI